MSNLNLKSTQREFLASWLKPGADRKLGYMTGVWEFDGNFRITHHDSVIARLEKDGRVIVTNAGYDSSTTRNRLNRVLSDNGLGYYITQRNWEQILVQRSTQLEYPGFVSAEFGPFGELIKFNTQTV